MPEEVIEDPHMVARGFPVQVKHEDLGREITYPGAFARFTKSPVTIERRAPHLGEHNADVFGALPR